MADTEEFEEKPRVQQCKNCGQKTLFRESCDIERLELGWCVPCFENRQCHGKDRDQWRKPGVGVNPFRLRLKK